MGFLAILATEIKGQKAVAVVILAILAAEA
jgi:hypothetical protein